jgi:aminoglycoside 6'-N-acetyltransferase I
MPSLPSAPKRPAARPGARGAAAIAVRAANSADLAAVVALAAVLWPEDPVGEHRKHMRALLAGRPRSTLPLVVLLAELGGQPIGFIEVGLRSHAQGCDGRQPVGFIEGWLVEAAHRGRGVGRRLMAAAEVWARGQGCVELASDTWQDHADSQRAHRALGFEVVDRVVNFRKPLAPIRRAKRIAGGARAQNS